MHLSIELGTAPLPGCRQVERLLDVNPNSIRLIPRDAQRDVHYQAKWL